MPHRLALLALLLLWPTLAHAGDGALTWRTLRAPGVQVHFPSQLREFAQKVIATYSDARATLSKHFPYDPPLLHLTLDDYSDGANGFATVLPYDHVHLQAYPPEVNSDLADHGDWVRALVFHELTHVMHMGEVSGIPKLANHVVGRRWLPNQALPRFFLEGLATYAETRFTGQDKAVAGHGGRVDSAQYMALLRAAVLDKTLPTLDELTGQPVKWPRGNGWYLYGGVLLDYLARTYGHDKIQEFLRKYGARVVPFGINSLAREVWGHSLQRLWEDAKQELTKRVHAEWTELGIDPTATDDSERLTFDGEWRGRIRPGTQPGTVVVAHAPKDGLVRIEELDVERKLRRVLHVCELDCDEPMVTPDGKWLLFTESRHSRRIYLFRELVAVKLPAVDATEWRPSREAVANLPVRGKALRLTVGARMRSPSVTPDGREVLYVAVREGRTEIRALDLPNTVTAVQAGVEAPKSWLVVEAPALGEVLDSPVADTSFLYWTRGIGDRRRAVNAGYASRSLVRGVEFGSDAKSPTWVSDLQVDRRATGIEAPGCSYDHRGDFPHPENLLFAVTQQGARRVAGWYGGSNVLAIWGSETIPATGVVSATWIGWQPVTVEHRGAGLDVFVPKLPAAGAGAGAGTGAGTPGSAKLTPEPAPEPEPVAVPADLPYAPTPITTTESPYHPWQSAYPRAWYPLLLATGDNPDLYNGGAWLGLALYGQDALDHWNWTLSGQLRSDGTDPIVLARLRITRWEPTWELDSAYQQGYAFLRRGFRYRATPTDRLGFRAAGSWALPGLRDAWTFTGGLRAVHSALRNDRYRLDFPYDPGGPEPIEPWTGWEQLADLGVSWGYGESYPESIAADRLHLYSLGATIGRRADGAVVLGNTGKRVILDVATAHHFPLGKRRVLALDAHLIAQPVSPDEQPAFTVQGLLPLSAAMVLGPLSSGIAVRGAAGDGATLLAGNGIAFGTASLFVPLLDVGHGLDLLPVYGRRLFVVPFADAAYAFLPPKGSFLQPGGIWSVGAELRLDYDLGYQPYGLVRLGFAHAFGEFGGDAGYLTLGL